MAEIPNALVILMGMGVVFIGLICIVILISIVGAIIPKFEKNKAAEVPIQSARPVQSQPEIQNRGEIIAAVAACLAEELGTDVKGLRIVSFKKVG